MVTQAGSEDLQGINRLQVMCVYVCVSVCVDWGVESVSITLLIDQSNAAVFSQPLHSVSMQMQQFIVQNIGFFCLDQL